MIEKTIDAIEKADVDALITDSVGESASLEYKQELPGNKDDDKKEFLADISSFANARGGDIVYGVEPKLDENGKKTGEPGKVVPIAGTTPDEAKLRLEEIIRNGVAPRMRVQVREITGWDPDATGFVILVRIPQSFSSPHMVTYKGTSRFYSRNSAGKYQLDVAEIRSAVLTADSQAERIRRFREERLAKIVADDVPAALSSPDRVVLHLVPIPTFLNRDRIDLSADAGKLTLHFAPLRAGGWGHRFNLDGHLTSSVGRGGTGGSYCQLFFDGTIEAAAAGILGSSHEMLAQSSSRTIASVAYEKQVIEQVQRCFEGYRALGVSGPFAVSLAILGCRGSVLAVEFSHNDWGHPLDRGAVILQDVIVENLDAEITSALKPLFDQLWNAFGFSRCLDYSPNGVWNPNWRSAR